jgi:hypothetical protein
MPRDVREVVSEMVAKEEEGQLGRLVLRMRALDLPKCTA